METILNWFNTFPNSINADTVINTAFALSILSVFFAYLIFYIWIGRSKNEIMSKYNKLRHWRFIAFLVFFVNFLVSIVIGNYHILGWGLGMYIFGFINAGRAFFLFWILSLLPLKKRISIHTKSVPKLI